MKNQILSTEGSSIQFVERGKIVYVVHPQAVEEQIRNMFRQLDYAYTSDYVTVLLDYTEDERSARLPSIQKQMQEFQALILQSRQIYKNKRRYYQISFISKVAAFHFVKGLDFV